MKQCTLFNIGYEGINIDDFVNKIGNNKIDILLDVRELPWSRKNGFNKKKLKELFQKEKIEYFNFPELGSPKPTRRKLQEKKDYKKFFSEYSDYLDEYNESLMDLLLLSKKKRICLMCYEKDVRECHRKVIIEKLQSMNGVIKVVNL